MDRGTAAEPAEELRAVTTSSLVASGSVLTQHNDQQRTGSYPVETSLTPATVNPAQFGPIYRRRVKGNIVNQVLYVNQLPLASGGTKNAVIVATSTNYIYAFDADNTDPNETAGLLWPPLFLGPADNQQADLCHQVVWDQGIASTPVIDAATNRMYVVARIRSGSSVVQRLITVDLTNGAGINFRDITTAGFSPAPAVQFVPARHTNRPGLLLLNGNVYVGFAAVQCDNYTTDGDFQGWVFSYNVSNLTLSGVFTTASSLVPDAAARGVGGGIWQSGAGLSSDGTSIYAVTGNSFFHPDQPAPPAAPLPPTPGTTRLTNTVLKLNPGTLTVAGKFKDPNDPYLNCGDTDLASGGSVVLPGGTLIAGGKEGVIHLLSTTPDASQNLPKLFGFQAAWDTYHLNFGSFCYPTKPNCFDNGIPETKECNIRASDYKWGQMVGPNMHNVPAYHQTSPTTGLIFTFGEKDYLRSYRYNVTTRTIDCITGIAGVPCGAAHISSTARAPFGMPGGFVSVSSNGIDNAIAWALVETTDGQMMDPDGNQLDMFTQQPTGKRIYSYFTAADGHSLAELYRDRFEYPFVKFVPPTIAAGKVFRPTMSTGNLKAAGVTSYLVAYGPLRTKSNFRKLLPALSAIMP
jgi:hypothetical protein